MGLNILMFIGASIALTTASTTPNLKVRFDYTLLGIGSTAFIELPKSVKDASAARWTNVTRPSGPSGLSSLTLWCPTTDYTTCVLFDDTDYIAGMQIAIEDSRFNNTVYSWTQQGFTNWTITVNGTSTTFWATQQYFINETALATSSATRIANRDSTKLLQFGAVWVTGLYGELFTIPENVTDMANTNFTKQACIPWMGLHYYYNMTTTTDCNDANFPFPYFPLFHDGVLIGLGFVTYGKMNFDTTKTVWFEEPGKTAVELIVPDGPDCLYNYADSPGLITMHTFYISSPYLVLC